MPQFDLDVLLTFGLKESIHDAASAVAFNMMSYYNGNVSGHEPGLFPGSGTPTGYYWWEGSEAFAALMNFWYYTGDSSYNDVVTQAMLAQTGPDRNFEPPEQVLDLGNDDQAFWGFAAMTAAEVKFPNPPSDQAQWLPLAQAVFNRQVTRWDNTTCNGGMHWQFQASNQGYSYKSTIANGLLMALGARLGTFTGNTTYFDWAETIYDWVREVGFIDDDYNAHDGGDIPQNCSDIHTEQYSYNAGVFLLGTAFMHNGTTLWNHVSYYDSCFNMMKVLTGLIQGDPNKWATEATNILNRTQQFFFKDNIMFEQPCEDANHCNNDQLSYKSQLTQWMATTAKIMPQLAPAILPQLKDTANAAISVCNCGGVKGQCGFKWTTPGTCDGTYGMGQEINALAAIQIWAETNVPGPANTKTGGSGLSQGNPNAGGPNDTTIQFKPITTADRAGAGIITALIFIGFIGTAIWMTL